MKMAFNIDEKRLLEDGEYNLEEYYKKIDDLVLSKNVERKEEKGVYAGPDNNDSYISFGRAILALKNTDWFRKYVKEWYWFVDGKVDDIIDAIQRAEMKNQVS